MVGILFAVLKLENCGRDEGVISSRYSVGRATILIYFRDPDGGNEMESRTAGNELSVGADILHPKIIRADNSKECRASLFLVSLNPRDTR